MYCTKKLTHDAIRSTYICHISRSLFNDFIEYHLKPASIGIWNAWHNAHIHTNEKRK